MDERTKKLLALREKHEELEKQARAILTETEGLDKLTGEQRNKLDQTHLEIEQNQAAMAALETEQNDEARRVALRAAVERYNHPLNEDRLRDKRAAGYASPHAEMGSNVREDFGILRNSHELWRDFTGGLGSFFRAVAMHQSGRETDQRIQRIVDYRPDRSEQRGPSGLGETVLTDGSILIPPQYSAQLLQEVWSVGQILQRCQVIPMTSDVLKIPGVSETSRADGSRMGGIRAYWEAEAETATASKPKFDMLEFQPSRLTAACYVTDKLLGDVPALAAWLRMGFTDELTFKMENAVFRGSGAGQPLGILNSQALVVVDKVGGQSADTIVGENVIAMRARLLTSSFGSAVLTANQDTIPQLYTLAVTKGTDTHLIYMPAGGISQRAYDTVFGRPVVYTEYNPTLGDEGDIMFADFMRYLLAQRGTIESAVSIHVKFLENEQTFRFTVYVDGAPLFKTAITPFQGTATVSPFTTVQTRG